MLLLSHHPSTTCLLQLLLLLSIGLSLTEAETYDGNDNTRINDESDTQPADGALPQLFLHTTCTNLFVAGDRAKSEYSRCALESVNDYLTTYGSAVTKFRFLKVLEFHSVDGDTSLVMTGKWRSRTSLVGSSWRASFHDEYPIPDYFRRHRHLSTTSTTSTTTRTNISVAAETEALPSLRLRRLKNKKNKNKKNKNKKNKNGTGTKSNTDNGNDNDNETVETSDEDSGEGENEEEVRSDNTRSSTGGEDNNDEEEEETTTTTTTTSPTEDPPKFHKEFRKKLYDCLKNLPDFHAVPQKKHIKCSGYSEAIYPE